MLLALQLQAQKLASQYCSTYSLNQVPILNFPFECQSRNIEQQAKPPPLWKNITRFNALFRKILKVSFLFRSKVWPWPRLYTVCHLSTDMVSLGNLCCFTHGLAHRYCLQCSFHAVLTPCLIFNFYNLRFLMHRTVGVDLNLVPVVMHFLWGVAETSSYAP